MLPATNLSIITFVDSVSVRGPDRAALLIEKTSQFTTGPCPHAHRKSYENKREEDAPQGWCTWV